jgi:hypothetical protein
MTNGDYIRSLNNNELSIAIGCIVDEFTKLAITNSTYQYTLDEQIRAAHDWLNKQVRHDGKMIKEICKRLERVSDDKE